MQNSEVVELVVMPKTVALAMLQELRQGRQCVKRLEEQRRWLHGVIFFLLGIDLVSLACLPHANNVQAPPPVPAVAPQQLPGDQPANQQRLRSGEKEPERPKHF